MRRSPGPSWRRRDGGRRSRTPETMVRRQPRPRSRTRSRSRSRDRHRNPDRPKRVRRSKSKSRSRGSRSPNRSGSGSATKSGSVGHKGSSTSKSKSKSRSRSRSMTKGVKDDKDMCNVAGAEAPPKLTPVSIPVSPPLDVGLVRSDSANSGNLSPWESSGNEKESSPEPPPPGLD